MRRATTSIAAFAAGFFAAFFAVSAQADPENMCWRIPKAEIALVLGVSEQLTPSTSLSRPDKDHPYTSRVCTWHRGKRELVVYLDTFDAEANARAEFHKYEDGATKVSGLGDEAFWRLTPGKGNATFRVRRKLDVLGVGLLFSGPVEQELREELLAVTRSALNNL